MLWSRIHDDFLDAVDQLPDLVDQIKDFTQPGLGTWDIAGLCGHLLRGVRTPVWYLAKGEPMDGPVGGAEAYLSAYLKYRSANPAETDAAVATRGVEELAGIDPVQYSRLFRTAAAAARAALQGIQGDRKVSTPYGTYRIQDYLRTRTFEVVVHSIDLARAARIEWHPPETAINDALMLLADLARSIGSAESLLLALTGRTLPPDDPALPLIR